MARNMSFNINNFERATWSFTGKDEKLLLVRMPRKHVFDRMAGIQTDASFDEVNEQFSVIIAEILSNNQTGKKVTAQQVNDDYDFEEKLEIFNQYMEFVKGATSDPN